MIDPEQMRQVFWNLLINASQSMPDGGEIRIQFQKIQDTYSGMNLLSTNQKKGMEWVKISITDSGNGIGPQEIERIFDPFYTTKERGTGLGLSIVHKIIENHHGMIKVESEVGKGSTFTILLPVN